MIDPTYISGYVDGEGSFVISFSPRKTLKSGWEIRPSFSVSQRKDRAEVLSYMKQYFGCGSIRDGRDGTLKYEVRSIKDLVERIIPHFWKHPLLSSKQKDFEIFTKVCDLVFNKEHITPQGLQEIFTISSPMNPGGKRKYTSLLVKL